MWQFLLELIAQFAGGPGAPENNFVRFGLAAVMWAALLLIAWNRQREVARPREQLLLVGFGLALFRELFMLAHLTQQMLVATQHSFFCTVVAPLEHTLTLAAVIVIAGAFLRYILDNPGIARRYLRLGLSATALVSLFTFVSWSQQLAANPSIRFHQTDAAWLIHALGFIFLVLAITILIREQGWLRNLVLLALTCFGLSEFLALANFLTGRAYSQALCPIGNSLYIWAIPLFGFVYLREQAAERQRAEKALQAYRSHLEELVAERTEELGASNRRLQVEIEERLQAEAQIARHNVELAAQLAISDAISRSLDLSTVLQSALQRTLSLLNMDSGCIVLFEPGAARVELRITTAGAETAAAGDERSGCLCESLARRVAGSGRAETLSRDEDTVCCRPLLAMDGPFRLLVSTPLLVHERGIGALTLASATLAELPEQQLNLLRGVGQQIGVAVENARLYQQSERWARGVARLNELSLSLNATLEPAAIHRLITQRSAELLECPIALFYLQDQERDGAHQVSAHGWPACRKESCSFIPADSPILNHLAGSQKPVQIESDDTGSGLPASCRRCLGEKSMIAVAVRGRRRLLGFLLVAAAAGQRRWSRDELGLLSRFADRAGIALENAYLHQQLEWAAALEERQRIAAEMHDGLAQTLSYLSLKTDRARDLLGDGHVDELRSEFAQMRTVVDQASQNVRESIAALRERAPVSCSVQETLETVAARAGPEGRSVITVVTDLQEPLYLPTDEIGQLERIVQEAVRNAQRHGRASEVRLLLSRDDHHALLQIVDDGCGFDPEAPVATADHFGLAIMRARAARLDGELQVTSQPGAGTTVALRWPMKLATRELPMPQEENSLREPWRLLSEVRAG